MIKVTAINLEEDKSGKDTGKTMEIGTMTNKDYIEWSKSIIGDWFEIEVLK